MHFFLMTFTQTTCTDNMHDNRKLLSHVLGQVRIANNLDSKTSLSTQQETKECEIHAHARESEDTREIRRTHVPNHWITLWLVLLTLMH